MYPALRLQSRLGRNENIKGARIICSLYNNELKHNFFNPLFLVYSGLGHRKYKGARIRRSLSTDCHTELKIQRICFTYIPYFACKKPSPPQRKEARLRH